MPFNQLRDIADENRETRRSEAGKPPLSCPIDGELLEVRRNVHNCPLGNYRWQGGQRVNLDTTVT